MAFNLGRLGLGARFIVLALVAALPALAATVYSALAEYEHATDDAEVQLLQLTEVVARREQAMAEEARSVLSLLSRSTEISPDDPARCIAFLAGLSANNVINPQTFAVVSVADLDGNLYCSTQPPSDAVNVADRRYFHRVIETGQLTFGRALTGRASGQPTVPAAAPVVDNEGRVTAVLIAGLNLPEVARTALPDLQGDAVVVLLTNEGLVLGRQPDPEHWVGTTLAEQSLAAALETESTAVREITGLDGVPRIYAMRRTEVGDAEIVTLVGFATAQVYAAAKSTLVVGLAIAAAAALAAIALGWTLGRGLVSRSVGALADAAARIAAGDLSVRVAPSSRGDELASLTGGFNAMAAALGAREAALRESEARYREVVDLIPAAIWIHTGGRLVFVNDYGAQMFGAARPDELIGREIISLAHPDDREKVRERSRHVVESAEGMLPTTELRFQRLDGKTIVVEAQAIRYLRDGAAHVLSAGRDVTAQRAAEEQLRQAQKMEGIGRLTGGVAHDFNNLLTVVIGNLEMALDTARPEDRPLLENALAAADKGATLTQRLLAFSRQQALSPEAVDLNRLVSGMESILRRSLGEDIDIAMRLEPTLWPALIDRSQLETALLNLAVNARDAMPDGGKLTIETANVHLDETYTALNTDVVAGDFAMLAVTDTGSGMSPEVVARATDPFFTTKEVGRGTGLGLSMVYGFIKQSRGHLKIYSEVGQGTSVRLYLPRVTAADDVSPADRTSPVQARGGGESILVVEDEADLRAMVVRQLTDLGYRVRSAADGPSALDVLRTEPDIDLLFTDVVMPGGMTGRQLAEQAKTARPRLRVLFTSGYAERAIVHQGRLDAGTRLVSKPFKKQELAEKVRAALDEPVE